MVSAILKPCPSHQLPFAVLEPQLSAALRRPGVLAVSFSQPRCQLLLDILKHAAASCYSLSWIPILKAVPRLSWSPNRQLQLVIFKPYLSGAVLET
jgi:hypothetical protein